MAGKLLMAQIAFSQDVADLLKMIKSLGLECALAEAWRTEEQQAIYYKQGKSKTMDSQHRLKLAIDLEVFKFSDEGKVIYPVPRDMIQPVGDYWESKNNFNRWGGNYRSFYDPRHFERMLREVR